MIQVVEGSFQPYDWYALAQFEQLVLAQKPADKPWEPVTSDYSLKARRPIEQPHATRLIETFRPKDIIDAGAGPHGVLVRILREDQTWIGRIIGFDVNPATSGYVLEGDLVLDTRIADRFGVADLVICREVLEHLTVRQIAQAVRNLVALSTKYIYVTTRFHPNPEHLLDVATSDDLDPTHISLLNQDFLRTLFVLEGCKRRADLEARMDWQQKGRVLVYEKVA